MTVDRLIPSVTQAEREHRRLINEVRFSNYMCCDECDELEDHHMSAMIEGAALALDMALAQASDARRAEADEIRRSVAW